MDGLDHTFWYLTRASGFVAYLLLFGSVALGLLLTGGSPGLKRYDVYDLHRFLAILTLAVTLFHLFIVLPDAYIGFSLSELLIPFASPYHPVYMALGLLSFYLMLLAVASFYSMPLIPYAWWRRLHYSTFAVFVMALAHGLGSGTDTGHAVGAGALRRDRGAGFPADCPQSPRRTLSGPDSTTAGRPAATGHSEARQLPACGPRLTYRAGGWRLMPVPGTSVRRRDATAPPAASLLSRPPAAGCP